MQDRLVQTGAWDKNKNLSSIDMLNLLSAKIQQADFENAQQDVLPFIKDKQTVELWSKDFFLGLIQNIVIK